MISASNESAGRDDYDALHQGFHWHVPTDFNIARMCCERWASDAGRVAVLYEDDAGRSSTLGYAERRLIAELQGHVRGKLAPYEYPKEIEFLDAQPMTTTGKLRRRVLRETKLQRNTEKPAC